VDETYDPDDQFFQAFKAGFLLVVDLVTDDEGVEYDLALWLDYIDWQKS
jgi:hypothetical protein